LPWTETEQLADHVRKHGVHQFIRLWKKLEKRTGDVLKWGDEVEYNLVKMDPDASKASLLLTAHPLLQVLQKRQESGEIGLDATWHPEFAAYMIEGTPGAPYESSVSEFNKVQENMRKRRLQVKELLAKNEFLFSLTGFPRLGCPGFTEPPAQAQPQTSHTKSLFWPSEATFPGHPRFRNLARNIRMRRGQKVAIQVPVYPDKNTVDPCVAEKELVFGPDQEEVSMDVPKPGHIYMDAMGFGMGLSCLQITFQGCCVEEAQMLYDQLTPMCPIMLAMTASLPFFRGYLADVDCRWDVIAASVDCRTKEERGEAPLTPGGGGKSKFVIPKSRYGSVSSYISECVKHYNYNDVPLVHDPQVYKTLIDNGIKEQMAKHVAHLFIRDTVSLFSEKVDPEGEDDTDHFENIQSTNWQTMRFKPPPPNSKIGVRVEFRPCELQITDFENAAVCCFVVLLTRVILSYRYNLLVPISYVDKNMERAQKRDAILEQKFYFRRNINTVDGCSNGNCGGGGQEDKASDACLSAPPIIEELTMDEIFNGAPDKANFPGLIILIKEYLANLEVDTETSCTLLKYLSYLSDKAAGRIRTNARFMRDFVRQHPDYKEDSVVTDQIQFDLLQKLDKIQNNEKKLKEHLKMPHPPQSHNNCTPDQTSKS